MFYDLFSHNFQYSLTHFMSFTGKFLRIYLFLISCYNLPVVDGVRGHRCLFLSSHVVFLFLAGTY